MSIYFIPQSIYQLFSCILSNSIKTTENKIEMLESIE